MGAGAGALGYDTQPVVILAEGGYPERGLTEMLLAATAVANFLDSRLTQRLTPLLKHFARKASTLGEIAA